MGNIQIVIVLSICVQHVIFPVIGRSVCFCHLYFLKRVHNKFFQFTTTGVDHICSVDQATIDRYRLRASLRVVAERSTTDYREIYNQHIPEFDAGTSKMAFPAAQQVMKRARAKMLPANIDGPKEIAAYLQSGVNVRMSEFFHALVTVRFEGTFNFQNNI